MENHTQFQGKFVWTIVFYFSYCLYIFNNKTNAFWRPIHIRPNPKTTWPLTQHRPRLGTKVVPKSFEYVRARLARSIDTMSLLAFGVNVFLLESFLCFLGEHLRNFKVCFIGCKVGTSSSCYEFSAPSPSMLCTIIRTLRIDPVLYHEPLI